MRTSGRANRLTAPVVLTVLVLVLLYGWRSYSPGRNAARPSSPDLAALIDATANGTTRPLEARLSGGFAYGRVPALTRGATAGTEVDADVLLAAADIQKRAVADDSPRHRAMLGVAYAVIGDLDRAVDALENATTREPGSASYFVDLSAVYFARGHRGQTPGDWAAALAAANRAIARGATPEAHFNRALALERLHLTGQAIAAWATYRQLDPSSAWAREAAERLDKLANATTASASRDLQRARERLEDVTLSQWAAAVQSGDTVREASLLDEAEAASSQLKQAGGDAMAFEHIAQVRRAAAAGDRTTLRHLAAAHELYARARTALLADQQEAASDLMTDAGRHFRAARSPYAHWAGVFEAILMRNKGRPADALAILDRLPYDRLPSDYYHLRGRIAWGRGVALEALARFDRSLDHLQQATDAFRAASESSNLVSTQTILAEAEWILGDHTAAWNHILDVLSMVDRAEAKSTYYLWVAAALANSAKLPEAALEFVNARVDAATSARSKVEAYLQRAKTRMALGLRDDAASDLDRAAAAAAQLPDQTLRARNTADVRIARAEFHLDADPRQAIAEANGAIDYVSGADPAMRLARLLSIRANAKDASGDAAGALQDLVASIDEFEQKRAGLTSASDRLRAFDAERVAFEQLVRLQLKENPAIALRTAERSRVGAWQQSGRPLEIAMDPSAVRARIPPGTAIVYYEVLPESVLVWRIAPTDVQPFVHQISQQSLAESVARIDDAIRRGATIAQLMPHSQALFRTLIEPALRSTTAEHIVFVPDGPLWGLPFAALPDERGRPLIESRTIGVSPSLTTFLTSTTRLAGFDPRDVLAVGDGHDPQWSGLPRLPNADLEAHTVGGLYPTSTVLTSSSAVARRVLAADHAVFHFAGHTVLNREFPLFSRLLLAPEPSDDSRGALLASLILEHRFRRTRVAMLATCEAGAGRVIAGEGVASVARAFLAAGVPSVVASLWPVDDNLQPFMKKFHESLRGTRDAATALRSAQVAAIQAGGADGAVRTWGGFYALGGVTPLGLERREQ